MSAIAPFAASSVRSRGAPPAAPDQGVLRPHRPVRADPLRDLADRRRGAGLGLTMAAGVAGGINYLQRDLELALLAGAQVGSVAAGMARPGADRVALEQAARRTAGNPETGRALGLLGRIAVLRALLSPP